MYKKSVYQLTCPMPGGIQYQCPTPGVILQLMPDPKQQILQMTWGGGDTAGLTPWLMRSWMMYKLTKYVSLL